MNMTCLKRISETAFICVISGVIIYESFAGEHHDHLPHQEFNKTPVYVITTTYSGTSNASTSTTTL